MGQIHSEAFANVVTAPNLAAAFWNQVRRTPDAELLRFPIGIGLERRWRIIQYREAGRIVARLAHYLLRLGVKPGDRVAIISNTRPEWSFADLAILSVGAVTTSIYQSLPWHEAGYILYDSNAVIAFAENDEQVAKLLRLTSEICPIPPREDFGSSSVQISISKIISFEVLPSHERVVSYHDIVGDDQAPDHFDLIPNEIQRISLASLVYTSGTTGPPKGVMQTHGNHLANVYQAAESGIFLTDGSLFLYLPLAHSFARLAHYIGFLTPTKLVYPGIADVKSSRIDLQRVAEEMRESGVEVIPSVPRLFEKMQAVLRARAAGRGLQAKILRRCIDNAERVYDQISKGRSAGILERIAHLCFAPIRKKIRLQLFGKNFSHGIAGGAKFNADVNRFFDALGMTICEGYGLTETCVATHVNRVNRRRIGSVGPALIDIGVRIDPNDGEILLRGPNITSGYWNRPRATADAYEPTGWFRTGDIGRVDEDGFLYITDRKKDLIITAGGKKIPPQSIEGLFKTVPFISQAVLCGEGRPYCSVLITINPDEAAIVVGMPIKSETGKEALHAAVGHAIEKINLDLASHETIKRFTILDHDFTIENGLLTPTLKVRRKAVFERYGAEIAEMYRE